MVDCWANLTLLNDSFKLWNEICEYGFDLPKTFDLLSKFKVKCFWEKELGGSRVTTDQ